MKNKLLALSIIIISSSSLFASGKKELITIKTNIICDHCLQCNSCGQNINDKIRASEKGIKKVKINAKENTIEVTYLSDKTNPNQIRKAISAAGFDVDEIKASSEGYSKLDGCCKVE